MILTSIADLRHHAESVDLQLLDTVITRATENKLAEAERLARDTMARKPEEIESLVPRRPASDRMAVGD